ncbi:DUF6011 domain-containing protein [Streptomyces turgidiscabies]|uniref:DUF6011 domain-containing protein n=1 Tax=Streptomyces turgidiscabies TaxID=85558 RepID=UPI0038F6E191
MLCPCGRKLRTPESRSAGIGPVCARKLAQSSQEPRTGAPGARMPPKASRRPTGAPVPSLPGQTELPLQPLQVTLWSL